VAPEGEAEIAIDAGVAAGASVVAQPAMASASTIKADPAMCLLYLA
jgi:hypothetical protein